MTTKPTLRELIDACRLDQHDPQRAELAADLAPLAREVASDSQVAAGLQRSERFDRNVRSALEDVPLPAGLAERLLAKCEAAVVPPATPPEEAVGPRSSRRRLLAQLAIAASLLIVSLAAYPAATYIFQARRPVMPDELAQLSVEWFDSCGPGAKWESVNPAILAQYPLDTALKVRPKSFRQVDRTTVAYDLSFNGKRGLLFVHRPTRPHPKLSQYPYSGLPASGGISLGAWQRGKVVYVIGVTGSERSRPVDEFVIRPKTT